MIGKYGLSLLAGIALFSTMAMAQTQIKAVDVSREFKVEDHASQCGFYSYEKSQTLWWNCVLWPDKSLIPPMGFLVPVNEKVNFDKGIYVDANLWISQTVLGAKNNLLVMGTYFSEAKAVNLNLVVSSDGNQWEAWQAWEYKAPISVRQNEHLDFTQGQGTPDGGYVVLMQDFTPETYQNHQDRFTVVKLNETGQVNWQYDHAEASFIKRNAWIDEPKGLLLTDSGKVIIYGTIYPTNNTAKSALICLNSEGKEINKQVFENQVWTQHVTGLQHGFTLFGNSPMSNGKYSFNIFDQNCQKIKDQSFAFPSHASEHMANHRILEAVMIAGNGDLLIAYLEEKPSDKLQPNEGGALYLLQITQAGKFVRDIPIIAGDDANRSYLYHLIEGNEMPLDVTLATIPKTNEILIAVQNNYLSDPTKGKGPIDWKPKIYKVKLP